MNTPIDKKENSRDQFLDSLKFLLIILVVFGHTLQYTHGEDSQLRSRLFMFIYSFHMPLFIFVSGYLSKNISLNKFIKGLPSLLATYIIFQTILTLPALIEGKASYLTFLLQPTGVMWYIACLILWRLLFSFIPNKGSLAIPVIALSFIVSLSAGYFLSGNMAARAFTFLPYFALGYYCSSNLLNKIRSINKVAATAFLLLTFFAIYEFAPKAFVYTLYGDVLYSNLAVSSKLFSVSTMGAIFRVMSFGLAIAISCAIICLTPNSFHRCGNKTLYVYLLHAVIVYLGYYTILNYFNISSHVTMHFIVALIIVWFTVALSKLKIIQYLVDPINNIFKKK